MARVIAVVNYKGGSTKTTTSAFLSQTLHDAGLSVLLIDADPQGSALRWAECGWPMTTVGLPVRNLHAQLPALATGRDVVIVDTPPLDSKTAELFHDVASEVLDAVLTQGGQE